MRTLVRRLVPGLVLPLLLVGLSPSQAADQPLGTPATPVDSAQQVGPSGAGALAAKVKPKRSGEVTAAASVDYQWTVVTVKFTKSETSAIAVGSATCGVIVSKLPTLISKILSAGCGLLAIYAGNLVRVGDCLKVDIPYSLTYFVPKSWNC